MSKETELYDEVFKAVADSQKCGFELCLKILKDINERLKQIQSTEALFLQAIITELDGIKEDLFKTENE